MKTLLIVATFLVVVSSQAQVRLGGTLGISLGTFSEPGNLLPGTHWLYKAGFVGGLAGDIPIFEDALLAFHISYFQKGVKTEVPFFATPTKAWVTNGFVEIEVFFRYCFSGPFIPWYVEAGPSIGRLLKSNTIVQDPFVGTQQFASLDAYKRTDATLAIGLGSESELTPALALTYSIHYYHGFMRTFMFGGVSKTRTFQASVGVLYTL